MTTSPHIIKASWIEVDGATGYEFFGSLDGELFYSFGHVEPEEITAERIEQRAEGDGNFKPMGYHRNWFDYFQRASSFASHVEEVAGR